MIYFLRSADIAIDSRLRRYQMALAKTGQPFRSIYWDRGGLGHSDDNTQQIRYVTPTGFGQQRATMFAFLLFNLFILQNLWRNRRDIDAIHAVDLDTVFPAALFAKLTGLPLIFDLYDSFIESRAITGPLRYILDRLERWVIRCATIVIIADPARVAQHPPIPENKLLVIENVPVMPVSVEIVKKNSRKIRCVWAIWGRWRHLVGASKICARLLSIPTGLHSILWVLVR